MQILSLPPSALTLGADLFKNLEGVCLNGFDMVPQVSLLSVIFRRG